MNVLDGSVDALAAYRLTRLATADRITRPARVALIRRSYARQTDDWFTDGAGARPLELGPLTDGEVDDTPEDDAGAPPLAAFVKCRWCTGLWISLAVVAARRYCPRLWDPLARALALSATAALVAGLEQ